MSLSKCSVCTDPETSENRILYCSCGASAHMMCYGVSKFAKNWKCSPCKNGEYSVQCELCLGTEGAFKATLCRKWVHVICALFTEGAYFVNINTMEPINIYKPLALKGQRRCDFCSKNVGVCHMCVHENCDTPIHITCAQAHSCTQELVNPEDDKIKFLAFCHNHKPNVSNRRISSNFVRERLSAKQKEFSIFVDKESTLIDEDFVPKSSSTHLGDVHDKSRINDNEKYDESEKVRKNFSKLIAPL